jgi:hypothetical protein
MPILADPSYTGMRRPACGRAAAGNRKKEMFCSVRRGFPADIDQAGAVNIKNTAAGRIAREPAGWADPA